jgi:hypothetical protein
VTLADRASLYYLGAALFLPETLVSLSATCVTNVGDIAEGGRLLVAGIVGLVALVVGLPAGAVWYVLALRRCAWTLSHLFGLPADRTAEGGFNGPRVVFRSLIWATIASLIVVAILLSLAERILLAVS